MSDPTFKDMFEERKGLDPGAVHLNPGEIDAYLLGQLSEPELESAESHLEDCDACAVDVEDRREQLRLEALRGEEFARRPKKVSRRASLWTWVPTVGFAAASVVLLALYLGESQKLKNFATQNAILSKRMTVGGVKELARSVAGSSEVAGVPSKHNTAPVEIVDSPTYTLRWDTGEPGSSEVTVFDDRNNVISNAQKVKGRELSVTMPPLDGKVFRILNWTVAAPSGRTISGKIYYFSQE